MECMARLPAPGPADGAQSTCESAPRGAAANFSLNHSLVFFRTGIELIGGVSGHRGANANISIAIKEITKSQRHTRLGGPNHHDQALTKTGCVRSIFVFEGMRR